MIGQAAQRAGLSIDTIRYYENIGLLAAAGRSAGGRRMFSDDDVAWLVFLRRMRETGMPIAALQRYVAHRCAGTNGVAGVLTVLGEHHGLMLRQRAELDACLELVDTKIAKYERLADQGQAPGPPEVDLE